MRISLASGLLFVLLCFNSCSENKSIESKTENQQRIARYYNTVFKLKYIDYTTIPQYADSIADASENEANDYKAMGFIARATYHLMIKNLQPAFINFNSAENLLRKDGADSLKLTLLNGLGNYYNAIGDYPKALESLLGALKIAEKLKNDVAIAGVNSNLGQLYLQKGDTDLAKINLDNTLNILNSKKNEPSYLVASHLTANMYGMAGNFEKALAIDEEGLRLCDAIKSNYLKVTFLDNKANCFMYGGQLDSAKIYFKECLRLDILNNNKKQISDSYSNLAQLAAFDNNELEVKDYAQKSINLSKEVSYTPGLTKVYQVLIDYYTAQKNTELVAAYQNLYLQVYKTLLNEKKEAAMVQYQTLYETEKKENELLLSEATVSKRNKQLQLSIVALLAILVIAYQIYRQQKTKNTQQTQEFKLKSALAEIEVQNKLQQQRLGISRDLHDNIGAQLTFIISSVENLKFSFNKIDSKFEDRIAKIGNITRETIVELRDTIWAMNSGTFTMEELRARLLNYMVKAKESYPNLKFQFTIEDSLKDLKLSSAQGINVYRIMQEALNNALKYSACKNIQIAVEKTSEAKINISIIDDGKGFDITEIEFGNGLNNMETRAEHLGGELSISSKPENGTKITLLLNSNKLQ